MTMTMTAHQTAAARPVDLRSDTITRPTAAMYERMRSAPIGDDGLDGDPSVQELEHEVAHRLSKDAGLFVPSCTMANLLAVLSQSQRNAQVVLESNAHMYTSERGSATFTGMFFLGVAGTDGAMDVDQLETALQSGGHQLPTALVALETSHNNAGGAVLPLEHMQTVYGMAQARGVAVHLDGARLVNAAVALNVTPAEIARHADTVSLCLSKGLSAPVGAVLAGPRQTLARARTLRRMLGGTQRQAGIMAAAGLEAVRSMGERLAEDHTRARQLSDGINALGGGLTATVPQTNIVQIETAGTTLSHTQWVAALEAEGLRVRPWMQTRLRCVTHRHIGDADIDRAVRSVAAAMVRTGNGRDDGG